MHLCGKVVSDQHRLRHISLFNDHGGPFGAADCIQRPYFALVPTRSTICCPFTRSGRGAVQTTCFSSTRQLKRCRSRVCSLAFSSNQCPNFVSTEIIYLLRRASMHPRCPTALHISILQQHSRHSDLCRTRTSQAFCDMDTNRR